MQWALLIALSIFLAGCATPYQTGDSSVTGGHFNKPITPKLEKIIFSANGYTDKMQAVEYALFRCAEFAQERNKPYFFLYPSLTAAALHRPSELPNLGVVGAHPTAFAYVQLLDKYEFGAIETEKVMQRLHAALQGSEGK